MGSKPNRIEGLLEGILRHQPRIVSAPRIETLPWWIACRDVGPEELAALQPAAIREQRRESLIEISPDRIPAGSAPLLAALRATVEGYRRERFSLPLRRGPYEIGPKPRIVGVLNATPDSFYDGGRYDDPERAVSRAEEMVASGADWIDVGGESSRPGSDPVPAEEEINRVLPIVAALAKRLAVPVSIDTMKAAVAERALEAGAEIVNDVSGLRFDPGMAPLLARLEAPAVLNHMRGTPKTMQEAPHYEDVVADTIAELRASVDRGLRAGMSPTTIVADPGIGFGKRPEDNLEILRRLHEFRSLGLPLLVGVSRKSFIGKALEDRPPEKRLWGTAGAVAAAVLGGALLLRVHDPAEMKDAARVAAAIGLGRL